MDNAIEALQLGRKYGKIWGLKNATFTAQYKRLVVIVGPNGAGKTTTVNILTTNLKPTKGSAKVLGYDIVQEYKKIRRRIAYMPQEFTVGWDHTPLEVVTWNLVARGWSIVDSKKQTRKWLELMGLWNVKDKPLRILSGGQRRRATVATVLATNADVFFLDEPTVGLDVEIRNTVWKAIRDCLREGSSIILTTHDMKEAQMISDKVVLINKGVTIVEDTPINLVRSMPYKYRIIIEKIKGLDIVNEYIDIGDRLIIYAMNYDEAIEIASRYGKFTNIFGIESIGLEDAYLRLISGDRNV